MTLERITDPKFIDWSRVDLPDAWPDRLNFRRFQDFAFFLQKLRGKRIERVRLPEALNFNVALPKYILQEFHNLPNGNYSKQISRGYCKGFDLSMLGKMDAVRRKLSSDLASFDAVLDVGCGGGHTSNVLKESGIDDVWGLDASPYLLQHAANDYPQIKFVQGLAEKTGFSDNRFDGISACFVFHEIPPKFANEALLEFHRVLKPGGLVTIAEPAPEQMYQSAWSLLKRYGLAGLYFKFLAHRVHEPFVRAWHKVNYSEWAESHGFVLKEDTRAMPIRYLLLERV